MFGRDSTKSLKFSKRYPAVITPKNLTKPGCRTAPGLFLWQAGRARRVAARPAIRLCAVARLCRALPQGRHSRVRRPLFLRQTVQRRQPVQAGASVF